MFKGDRNFVVGLFVSAGIAAFVLFVFWLTGRSGDEVFTHYSMKFHRDVSGLAVGGPVKYMGMNIGSVVHMSLEKSADITVRVDVEILESTPIDGGTYATLALQGITGVAVVNLAREPGDHPPLRKSPEDEYPVIPVRVTGFSAIMSSMPRIMEKLDALLVQAGELLGEENRASISGTLSDLNTMTSSLAENREAIAALPGDLQETLAQVQSTVSELRTTMQGIQPDLDATMDNIRASSENLASLTGRVDQLLETHEADMARFMEDGLGEAPELMASAARALRDLEKLMAELRDDPSQLVHRPPVEEREIEP